MKKLIIYFLFGAITLLASCEKEGDKVTFMDPPVSPTIVSLPDMKLTRDNSSDTLTFVGAPVDPGFTASAKYYLEACLSGNNFENYIEVYTGVQVDEIKFSVVDLNQVFLEKFPEDQTSSVDFRIRAELVVDGGTGAPGTGDNLFEYTSDISTANVTIFGLPRLDLTDSGKDQKIVSPLDNGKFESFVELDPDHPFKLFDPVTNKTYGAAGSSLAENGDAIVPGIQGYHKLTVKLNDMTFSLEEYRIGVVGSATANGWDAPDQKMDYDLPSKTWIKTLDLVVGDFKFRKNDDWGWNLGGDIDALEGGGDNIPIEEAGNYTITLTITSDADKTGTYTIVKND
jgi:starch-binding outer membrane protein SusE/F